MADNSAAGKLESLSDGSDTYRPVTASIDFGTTSSGFAFVFDDNQDNVQINKWVDGSSEKDKAPTTVLLKEDKTFASFGYSAEDQYADLCTHDKHKGWRYFHNFKMALYGKDTLSRKSNLYDVEGKPLPAIEVLSVVICHLKSEILTAIRIQRPGVSDDDVMYVITVPAIWSDAAKQLMRVAATSRETGIKDDQLRLVLEPEAASVYCSRKKVEIGKPLQEGQVYIIVDIGGVELRRLRGELRGSTAAAFAEGGTVDMATHELLAYERLHEKYAARGNNMGGHYFNKMLLEFLEKLFGPACFQKWKTTECGEFLALERDIEEIKRKVGDREDDAKLRIAFTLLQQYDKHSVGKGIESFETSKDFNHAIISSQKGCITLKNLFLREFLKQISVAIEAYLTTIINGDPSVKLIFLVGGLAKSRYVRQYIESQFPDCSVVVPEDPGVAVLKGAVLLANRPQTIASRLARYSYGIAVTDDFIPGVHRNEYKITLDNKARCNNVFKKLIEKGEVLKYGQRFTTTTHVRAKLPRTKKQTRVTYLYQSTKTSPMYSTDDGCSELGGFEKHPPKGGWPDYCKETVELIVGEAEFKLQVSDDLGRKYETKIDFLLACD